MQIWWLYGDQRENELDVVIDLTEWRKGLRTMQRRLSLTTDLKVSGEDPIRSDLNRSDEVVLCRWWPSVMELFTLDQRSMAVDGGSEVKTMAT